MNVKDIMTKDPCFINPDYSIIEAARKMKELDCGILPVGEDKNHCIGMVTDRDIVLRVLADGHDPKQGTVKDAMTKEIHACCEDDSLEDAADLMRRYKVNRLLVKSRDGKVTGIITFGAMLWKTSSATEVGHILDRAAPRRLTAL